MRNESSALGVLGVRAPWGAIEGALMSDADKYNQYAIDCERIARTMTGEQRGSLLAIAEAWRELAREAERKSVTDGDKP
jgi:hypothetical protein